MMSLMAIAVLLLGSAVLAASVRVPASVAAAKRSGVVAWEVVVLRPLAARLAQVSSLQPVAARLQPAAQRVQGVRAWSAWMWLAAVPASALLAAGFGLLLGGVPSAVVAAIAGGALPLMRLRQHARRHERRLQRQIADWLDGMALIVRAGQDFGGGVRRYADAVGDSELGAYLTAMRRDMQAGMRAVDALERMAARMALPCYDGMFLSLRTALANGLPLAELLTRHADVERQRRFERAEQLAAEAAVKLTGPLLLVFVALMLLLIGPLLLLMGGGM